MSEQDHSSAVANSVDPHPLKISESAFLDAAVAHIKRSHTQAERAYYEGVWYSAHAGEWLDYIKDQVGHGKFERWRAKHLPRISQRTCQRYMELARFLRGLPEYPQVEPGTEPNKAVRAAQLKILQAQGFSSQRKALAIVAPAKTAQAELSAAKLVTAQPCSLVVTCDNPDDHWATPEIIVAAAIELFGQIALDPCGNIDPARQLPCLRTLTTTDNSLAPGTKWSDSLLIHPPLSNIEPFVDRAELAVTGAEADEALIVLPVMTDAKFASNLHRYARGFLQQRPTFTDARNELVRPAWPYMLVFLTRDPSRNADFAAATGHFADIFVPYRY